MKAITYREFGSAEKLHFSEVPTPMPLAHEVQIEIHYASVNPVDWKIREGLVRKGFEQMNMRFEFPLIPGWDASGIISSVGKDVKDFKLGDAVYAYCRKPLIKWGTYAEFICVDAKSVALKPRSLNFAQAAAVPLAGLTAWQSLYDAGNLQKGETVLIQAGAGGVGSLAIAFAHQTGAQVITTASSTHHPYAKDLGADFVIDYHKNDVIQKAKQIMPQGVDLALDTVGGKVLQESMDLVKTGGRLVSILEKVDPKLAAAKNINTYYVFVQPSGDQLRRIGRLFDQGNILPPRIQELPLQEAAQAQEINRQGHTCGKIVLKVR